MVESTKDRPRQFALHVSRALAQISC